MLKACSSTTFWMGLNLIWIHSSVKIKLIFGLQEPVIDKNVQLTLPAFFSKPPYKCDSADLGSFEVGGKQQSRPQHRTVTPTFISSCALEMTKRRGSVITLYSYNHTRQSRYILLRMRKPKAFLKARQPIYDGSEAVTWVFVAWLRISVSSQAVKTEGHLQVYSRHRLIKRG